MNDTKRMMPIGPLMIEHRLIEKMIRLIGDESSRLKAGGTVDERFMDSAVDFIRTYADGCHHGKEEDILFRGLKKKSLDPKHLKTMEELTREHILGRQKVKALTEAAGRYLGGQKDAIGEVTGLMDWLVGFYPVHIQKEDREFFKPAMEYFTKEEQDRMLDEMLAFDRMLIHRKYGEMVARLTEEKR